MNVKAEKRWVLVGSRAGGKSLFEVGERRKKKKRAVCGRKLVVEVRLRRAADSTLRVRPQREGRRTARGKRCGRECAGMRACLWLALATRLRQPVERGEGRRSWIRRKGRGRRAGERDQRKMDEMGGGRRECAR